MTCPFYAGGRHPCALGEPDGRHCGPRQYPVGPCNLDEIGRGEAWRAVIAHVTHNAETIAGLTRAVDADRCNVMAMLGIAGFQIETMYILDAVGWSP